MQCTKKNLMARSGPLTSDIYRNPARPEYRFRLNRFRFVRSLIDSVLSRQDHCRILDVGGTPLYWSLGADLFLDGRVSVDLLNLTPMQDLPPHMGSLVGDARSMQTLPDRSYDLCHSNSVIEHVGDWNDMFSMASEIRRIGIHYFVQAPNFWFPYEPHFRIPFFHWIPRGLRTQLLLRRHLGFYPRATDRDQARSIIDSIRLPTKRQMQRLFPDAEILPERIGPFTKSHMAIRQGLF